MKQLDQLIKEATPLRSYASDLETAITQVAVVCDQDDNDNNIFPGKKDVIETMANAVEKMRQVSSEIEEIKGLNFSEWDEIVLGDIHRQKTDFKDSVDKLGVVLEEMVQMLDVGGRGIDVYLLQYVADARQSLRALLQNLEMEAPENMHKS